MKMILIPGLLFVFPLPTYSQESPKQDENSKQEEQVFTYVDQAPEFPGGIDSLLHYLSAHILYPVNAIEANVEGRVTVRFMIDTEGSVRNVKVQRGIGHGCDEEAIRVVKMMPRWIPGRQNGKKVRVYYTLPVIFKLEDPQPQKN